MSVDDNNSILQSIRNAGWWQGSVTPAKRLADLMGNVRDDGYWVVASQTCNLYNPSFEKVPVIELVAAKHVEKCQSQLSKGDNPRLLHVQAMAQDTTTCLELDIQDRIWVDRKLLAELEICCAIADMNQENEDRHKTQWLDNFAGWMARSYTRVTLPDDFNLAVQKSKIKEVITNKIKNVDELYGVYFGISSADSENEGPLGLLSPPYYLEIWLITYESADPTTILENFTEELFEKEISSSIEGSDGPKKVTLTRSKLAESNGLIIRESGIIARSISEITLIELKDLVRYSMVDHLSDSSLSAPE